MKEVKWKTCGRAMVGLILLAAAVGGWVAVCMTGSNSATLEPVAALSTDLRDAAVERLDYTLVVNGLANLKSGEPRTICSNYEQADWDLDRVLDPLMGAGRDDADAWRDYHTHFTLLGILQNQSDLPFKEKVAQTVQLLRAFCASL